MENMELYRKIYFYITFCCFKCCFSFLHEPIKYDYGGEYRNVVKEVSIISLQA